MGPVKKDAQFSAKAWVLGPADVSGLYCKKAVLHSQIFQNPLIKEYTLIYTKDPYYELEYIP